MKPIYRAEDAAGTKPVLALDVDGVLLAWVNSWKEVSKLESNGYSNEGALPCVYYNPKLGNWLNKIIPKFQVIYCTGHYNYAHEHAGALLGLPEFDYVQIHHFEDPSDTQLNDDRRRALETLFKGRPLVWAEDEAKEKDYVWVKQRSEVEAPTLLIQPKIDEGLTKVHVDEISTWLGELAL